MHRSISGNHLLAPRACILGVFIKQLGLSGIQATEVSLSNLPIEATKTREEPCILALAETVNVYPLLVRVPEAFLDFKQRECQPSCGLICFDSKSSHTAKFVACVAK